MLQKEFLITMLFISASFSETYVVKQTPGQWHDVFKIEIAGRKTLKLSFEDLDKATNEHPDVEFEIAFIYHETTTNTAVNKIVDRSYGCLVGGFNEDHTVTYWQQNTTIERKKLAEIGGQRIVLGVEVISHASTNFSPVLTATGMVFQATQVAPSFSNPNGLEFK